jgi:hypothetical protein
MMHGHEKSRSAIVAVKPTNKARVERHRSMIRCRFFHAVPSGEP